MAATEHLARVLEQQLGFQVLRPADGAQPLEGFTFLGAKSHWGSVASVGVVRADGLTPQELHARADAFLAMAQALHAHAGSITIAPLVGSAQEVALGSFGVLLFVFEAGAPPALVRHVRDLKRGRARDKRLTVAWAVDAPAGKVHKHAGAPFGMVPKPRDLARALRP